MHNVFPAILLLTTLGCGDSTVSTKPASVDTGDEDTDTDDTGEACEPSEEVCDGVDNDCDGDIDEDAVDVLTFYADSDGDGFGDADSTTAACGVPSGYTTDDTDCDDTDAAISPDGEEVCDEVDNDCDSTTDEDDAADASTWYSDSDSDGYGNPDAIAVSCTQPADHVASADDCDDTNSDINPSVDEVCGDPADYNCDGASGYADSDGDGWAACVDCLDTNSDINPDAAERCDGEDNDCDGDIDEPDAEDAETYYADTDGDSYGDPKLTAVGCAAPSGYVDNMADCDDTDAAISPDGEEVCDEVDNDCSGDIDDSPVDIQQYYADADSDGYGDADSSTESCDVPSGYTTDDTDCDDTDATVSPDGEEVCDEVDNDCDGTTDEDDAADASTWHADSDGDGFGDADSTTAACDVPSGYVADDTDCDDTDAGQSPDADEVCSGEDDDCDGTIDEDDALDVLTFYADSDGDGFGDADSATAACDVPSGYVADDTDCDDTDAAISPDGEEVCDEADNDCDGTIDDSPVDGTAYYADVDGDGYGDADAAVSTCEVPSGYTVDDADCDDTDAAISPDGEEVCDEVDNDCDGTIDDSPVDGTTYYADVDGDGYGDADAAVSTCEVPSGYTVDDADCDDTDAAVYPGTDEYCDGIDNDCDGTTDEDDALDVLAFYADSDGDGYGDADSTTAACDVPSGYVADDTDCDDDDGDTWPGATEVCGDRVINDCDGTLSDAFSACGLSGDIDLTDADAVLHGEDSLDYAGYTVSHAGDINGDGLSDVLIGAYRDEEGGSDAGSAYLVLGLGSGSLADADAHFIGEDSDDFAGWALSGAGDVDGDGYDDLLIGAYGDDDGNPGAGATYLFFGSVTGDLDLSAADAKLIGEDSGDFAGWAVSSAGDVDGDGLDDILIGAYGDDDGGTKSGAAYLLFGGVTGDLDLSAASVQLTGERNSDFAGHAVSGAGDVDGDGLDDLLVGAYGDDDSGSEAGAVYVVLGGVSADIDLSAADYKITGEDSGDYLGYSVAGVGDFDGDGLEDILLGACQDDVGGSYSGAAYVVLGGLSGDISVTSAHAALIGESNADYAGWSVSGAGDVDGDGLDDLLIGAYGDDDNGSNAGAAYLILGGLSGYLDLSIADAKLRGEGSGDYAGRSVSGGGDIDGDGLSDLIVGAYGEDTGGSAAGSAYMVLGGGY
ncbi:MAG: MopE-related protein [Myxococcota bacterium]|nr:MopE-related protein [Myxococcota bacterium]